MHVRCYRTSVPQRYCFCILTLSYRPLPRAHSYKDAVATIRRTTTERNYQLVITRAYEEGEEQLLEEDDECTQAVAARNGPDAMMWCGCADMIFIPLHTPRFSRR